MTKQKTLIAEYACFAAFILAAVSCSNIDTDLREYLEDNEGVSYTVKHFQQNITDDEYTLAQTENRHGVNGKLTTAAAKEYEGFTAQEFKQKTVSAETKTAVSVYYDRNIITLTFKADGGSWSGSTADMTVKGKYGAAVTVTNPVKTGYTFSAWNSEIPSVFPSADAVYTALWITNSNYTITYNLAGGTNSAANPAEYNEETAAITLSSATKTGYTFAGWYSESSFTTEVSSIPHGSSGNLTLYAKWTPRTDTQYTVEHLKQNIADDNYTEADADTKTYTGTTGENTNAAANTYEGFTAQTVTQTAIAADGSTVVKIYYTRNIITLTFKADGGSWSGSTADMTVKGKYGAAVTVAAPVKTGYTFSVWNPAVPSVYPAADASYTATWIKAGDYAITYNLDGGTNSASNPASYNVETETITLAGATKTGYTFAGWYSDSGLTAAVTQIAKGGTGAVTLYAKWTANTDTAYKVEHYQQNTDGSTYPAAATYTENKTGTTGAQTAAAAKTYEGFTAGTVTQTAIAADGSTIVKLYYTRNRYTVTYNANGSTDGSVPGTQNKLYNVDLTLESNSGSLAKTGYAFSGWNTSANGTGTAYAAGGTYAQNSAVTLYAVWTGATPGGSTSPITSNEITVKESSSGSSYTYTADTECTSYTWYVDGVKQTGTGNTFTFDATSLASGTYEVLLVYVKNSVTYSKQFTVTK